MYKFLILCAGLFLSVFAIAVNAQQGISTDEPTQKATQQATDGKIKLKPNPNINFAPAKALSMTQDIKAVEAIAPKTEQSTPQVKQAKQTLIPQSESGPKTSTLSASKQPPAPAPAAPLNKKPNNEEPKKIETTPDTQGSISENTAGNFMQIITRPDEDLLIFELLIGEISLQSAILVYQDLDTDRFYLPLNDFVDALEFPIDVNADKGTASGWFIDEKHTFSLRLEKSKSTIKSDVIPLGVGDIERHEDGIYVSLELLQKWFPMTIDVDFSKLAIIVKSLRPLPVENRIARDQTRSGIREKNTTQKILNPLEEPKAKSFTLPFLDISLQSMLSKSANTPNSFRTEYSAKSNSIFLGQDLNFNLSGQTGSGNSPDMRITAGRQSYDNDLLGFMSEYRLGDISSTSIPLIASSNAGRGFFFTNIPLDTTFSGEGNVTTIRGDLSAGYQVDIKQNGELLAFIDKPDENGEYVFEDLTILPGLNVFELVFYGPQGQEYTKEKRIYAPVDNARKGKINYRFHGLQDKTNLLTNRIDSDMDVGKLRLTAEADYGLNEITSLYGAAAHYNQDGQSKLLGMLGVRTSLYGFRFDLNQAKSKEGYAVSLRIESVFKGLQVQSLRKFYKNFKSEKTEQSPLSGNQKHETNIRITGLLPSFSFLKQTPFTLKYNSYANEDNDTYRDASFRVTKNIKKARITSEIVHQMPETGDDMTDLKFQISSRFDNFNIRGTANYNINPDSALTNIDLTSDWYVKDDTSIRMGLTRSGNDNIVYAGTLGINKDFGHMRAGLTSSYDNQKNLSVLMGLSFGFAHDSITNKSVFSSKNLSESGGLVTKVFHDLDNNGTRDENEPLLNDVKIAVKGNKHDLRTDEDGLMFTPHISGFNRTPVELARVTLPDPFMKTSTTPVDLRVRPSQVAYKEYPVISVGELDGTILIRNFEREKPAASIKINIKSTSSDFVMTNKSEYDGFFLAQDIPVGTYTVAPDEAQLAELGYCSVPAQDLVITQEDSFKSLEAPLVLYPDPNYIEDKNWVVLYAQNDVLNLKVKTNEIAQRIYDYTNDDEQFDKPIFAQDTVLTKNGYYILPPLNDPFGPFPLKKDTHQDQDLINLNTEKSTRLLTGPFNDLEALQYCDALSEAGLSCAYETTTITCDDYKALSPYIPEIIKPQDNENSEVEVLDVDAEDDVTIGEDE